MFTKAFWKSTSERAVHTAAQTLVATLGLNTVYAWLRSLSAAAFVRCFGSRWRLMRAGMFTRNVSGSTCVVAPLCVTTEIPCSRPGTWPASL
ncbi:holin [Streptomyces sp. NPDC055036]